MSGWPGVGPRSPGPAPLQASSGRTAPHRLNRGGDRALNRVIHTIAATRMHSCTTTRAYVARRTAEGKTTRELYRTLTATMIPSHARTARQRKDLDQRP